jgi:hypothetical protein
MRNLDGGQVQLQGEPEEPVEEWFYTDVLVTRTVNVVEPLEEPIYANDMLKMQGPGPVALEENEDLRMDIYDIYPVIIQYDAEGNELLYTAVLLDSNFRSQPGSIDHQEMLLDYNWTFDDIALLNTPFLGEPQLYGLEYDDVYKIEPDGSTTFVFNVYQEMSLAYGQQVPPIFNFLGMTADENDNLVIPTIYANVVNGAEVSVYDFEDALLYFDPDGFLVEVESELEARDSDPIFETRYLNGLGLIDYDNEVHPIFITDIAYNEDLTKI